MATFNWQHTGSALEGKVNISRKNLDPIFFKKNYSAMKAYIA